MNHYDIITVEKIEEFEVDEVTCEEVFRRSERDFK
jgi:hypothetical protein